MNEFTTAIFWKDGAVEPSDDEREQFLELESMRNGHAPDSVAAPSGTSANSYDRPRYAFGHVIWADADALQARPPSNRR